MRLLAVASAPTVATASAPLSKACNESFARDCPGLLGGGTKCLICLHSHGAQSERMRRYSLVTHIINYRVVTPAICAIPFYDSRSHRILIVIPQSKRYLLLDLHVIFFRQLNFHFCNLYRVVVELRLVSRCLLQYEVGILASRYTEVFRRS